MLLFDCLLTDFLFARGMDVERLRAAIFKYGLQDDKDFGVNLAEFCHQLKLLSV